MDAYEISLLDEYNREYRATHCIHCGIELGDRDNGPACQDIEGCTARKPKVKLEDGATF